MAKSPSKIVRPRKGDDSTLMPPSRRQPGPIRHRIRKMTGMYPRYYQAVLDHKRCGATGMTTWMRVAREHRTS